MSAISMTNIVGIELSAEAKRAIFKRGRRLEQVRLMDLLWNYLKEKCPDADCRPQQRFVGLYLNTDTNRTFARINSRSDGPRIGIGSKVVDAFDPDSLEPEHFPDWGGPHKGFVLEDSSIWELKELMVLSYNNTRGQVSLSEFSERKRKQEQRTKEHIESLVDQEPSIEGKVKQRTSIVAERDPKLRAAAIHLHGLKCKACDFDFELSYGETGKGFIEVHHLYPFSESPGPRRTNPETDLTVLCANCHRMIHRKRNEVLAVEDLREIIDENRV